MGLDRNGLLFELLSEDMDGAIEHRKKVEKRLRKLSDELDACRSRETRLMVARQQFEPSLEGFDVKHA